MRFGQRQRAGQVRTIGARLGVRRSRRGSGGGGFKSVPGAERRQSGTWRGRGNQSKSRPRYWKGAFSVHESGGTPVAHEL